MKNPALMLALSLLAASLAIVLTSPANAEVLIDEEIAGVRAEKAGMLESLARLGDKDRENS